MKKLLFLIVASILFANSALNSSLLFIKSKKYDLAYPILKKLVVSDYTNIKYNYLFGIVAAKLNKTNEAIAAFERILMYDPENKPAKYELAKLYFKLKRYTDAEVLFKELKNYKNSKKYLKMIDILKKRNFFNLMVGIGYFYDSNVKNVTDSNTFGIYLGDIYLDVNNTAEVKSDRGLNEMINFTHRYVGDKFLLKNSFLVYNKHYFNTKSANIALFRYSPEIKKKNLTAKLLYSHILSGNEDYLNEFGAGIGYKNYLFLYKRKVYISLKDKDSNYYELSGKWLKKYKEFSFIPKITLSAERKIRGDNFDVDYNGLKGVLNSSYKIFNASIGYEMKNYLDENPLFKKERKDRKVSFNIGISKIYKKFIFSLSAGYVNNNSNIPINDYDKKSVSLNILYKGL